MEIAAGLLKFLVPLGYAACLWAYGALFFGQDETHRTRRAQFSLFAALFLHTALLAVLAIQYRRCPLWTQGEALLFMAWMLAVIHLVSEWSADTRRLGIFTLGPAALCATAALFFLGRELVLAPEYRSSWFIFHILASLASYTAFSLAAVLAALYLVLHHKLKKKNFDITFRKLPPLENLDKLSAAWSFLGSLLMLTSGVIGAWWVRRDALQGMTPREVGIFAVLAVFLTAAIGRRAGWRGRRHAQWVLAGFVVLLLVNLVGIHGFSL